MQPLSFLFFVTVASELQKTKGEKIQKKREKTLPARKQSRPLNRSYRNQSRSEKNKTSQYNRSFEAT